MMFSNINYLDLENCRNKNLIGIETGTSEKINLTGCLTKRGKFIVNHQI